MTWLLVQSEDTKTDLPLVMVGHIKLLISRTKRYQLYLVTGPNDENGSEFLKMRQMCVISSQFFSGTLQMMHVRQMRVISRQKLIPQIRSSFTNDAREALYITHSVITYQSW